MQYFQSGENHSGPFYGDEELYFVLLTGVERNDRRKEASERGSRPDGKGKPGVLDIEIDASSNAAVL